MAKANNTDKQLMQALQKIETLTKNEELDKVKKAFGEVGCKSDGHYDNAKRYYLDMYYSCCEYIRTPSRAWPYTYLKHSCSAEHKANEYQIKNEELFLNVCRSKYCKAVAGLLFFNKINNDFEVIIDNQDIADIAPTFLLYVVANYNQCADILTNYKAKKVA